MATKKPKPKKAKYDPDLPSIKCPHCRGTGARPGAFNAVTRSREVDPVIDLKCPTCKGKGAVNVAEATEAAR